MRENNRTKILDAALRVVQRVGAGRLTLEAAADEAGVTRGGMTYHFRDRAALSMALQKHLAAGWETQLERAAGKSASDATAGEKSAAYSQVAMETASDGELSLILEGKHDAALNEPWMQVQRRWTPSAAEAMADPEAMKHFILRLAADGLWTYDSLSGETLTAETRQLFSTQITKLIGQDAT